MKLSIVVPVYNMAADGKLNYCMDSLVRQSLEDYEILAVNDGSTDNSLEVLREYEKRYPHKVRVITYSRNKRQGGAKNEGLKAARGEWVGFIDSDDWVTPDFYQKLIQKGEETGADLVGCDYNLVSEHTFQVGKVVQNNTMEQTGILDREKHKSLLMRMGSMVVKVYRREVIVNHKLDFPEGIFYEDNCAGPLWSLYFNHFERVEEPLYYYYQHQVSTVHHISEDKCRDRMKAAALLYDQCKERGFLEEYEREIEYRFTELYYVNTLFSYMAGVGRPRLSFVRELRAGIRERFPRFESNPYYRENTGEEERRLIALQQKWNLGFYLLYRLKLFVRNAKTSH